MSAITEGYAQGEEAGRRLSRVIIVLLAALAPVFFAVMFRTVSRLVSWPVPVATEGCFTVLYLMDIRLAMKGRQLAVLRVMPYLFAAGSLCLNVLAGHGRPADMVGYAMVTLGFFLPLLAGEAVLRRLAVSDDEWAYRQELADARAYAADLLRDRYGRAWRVTAPRLTRRQLRSGRMEPPVLEAIRAGARYGGAAVWQPAVRAWVHPPKPRRQKAGEGGGTEQQPASKAERDEEIRRRIHDDGDDRAAVAADHGISVSATYRIAPARPKEDEPIRAAA